ncbi:hypothetical protein F2P56_031156 [Juglans regia]|uniref:Uncharacterized protein n=2 Tax=Juglans regia TaxID=51240 RepID=A0A833U3A5_JUGRE|nr:uncharacterized protein LOC108997192 [Juglans regia]KAF5450837.1 hypothetical protein F2P56_031156 [Juglans regia]
MLLNIEIQVNEIQIQMEDSAGQVGVSLEFDFDFDDENLMENPNTQMPSNHDPHEVQNETAGNISTQENVDQLGSSSGSNDHHQPLIHQTDLKQNQRTPSTLTSTSDLSNPPVLENAQDLAHPATAFNPPLIIETPQSCCLPTTEYKESESPDGHCQPDQLNLGDSNWNYQQQAYINTSENQVMIPQVFSTPNLPSSLNATSMGALQPYPPTMMGLNGNDGAIQSLQAEYEANMIYPNQPMMNTRLENVPPNEHMPLPYNLGPLNEFIPNNQTILQSITSNNFNSIRQQPSLCPTLFPQNTIGVGVINQRQLPINQHRATLLPHNQLNAAYRILTPLGSQPNEFVTTNVFDPQCLNFMLPQAYALLRPQQSSNHLQQLNQISQVPNLLDPQFQYSVLPGLSMLPSYSPRSFLYHQVSVPPNVYDPQGFNSLLSPELSISARTPQLTNHQQQNQVWMAQNSLLPGSSTVSRLQELYGRQQLNQLTQLTPNLHPQLGSSILLEMLSGPSQLLDHYQVSVPAYACNPQQHNSIGARPSVLPRPQRLYDHKHPLEQVQDSQFCGSMLPQAPNLSRPQQSPKHQQLNQVPETANMRVDPQHDNILSPQSSRPSSSQTEQTCGLLNQAARQSVSCISPGTNSRQTQILNSKAQQEIGGGTKMAVPDLCETSPSSFKELEGNKRTATKRHVLGEPSQSPKRSKKERSLPPPSSQEDQDRTSQSEGNHEVEKEGNEVQNSNPSSARRVVKNTVYDPTYVGFGLPIDPHLRLFNPS